MEGGLNTYAYVANNPVKFSDPLGLLDPHGDDRPSRGIGRFFDRLLSGIFGDGTEDHPNHEDEADALGMTGAESCEELAWGINVLEAAIAWRKGDLKPEDDRNEIGRGHRKWIDKLEKKLGDLKAIYAVKCESEGKQCDR